MRIMDFSLAMYAEICKALQSHQVVTVQYYLSNVPKSPCIVLRHDVDRSLKNALAMAKLEHAYGIASTYYFRYPNTFNRKVIQQIYSLGHEIGYHYEALDKAKGDSRKAIAIFQKELEIFREFFPVKTICMHGNPLTKWDGRDLWSLYDFRKFGLLGEAFLSCSDISTYLTDTGRNWNGNLNFKDRLKTENDSKNLKSTLDLIRYLNSEKDSNDKVTSEKVISENVNSEKDSNDKVISEKVISKNVSSKKDSNDKVTSDKVISENVNNKKDRIDKVRSENVNSIYLNFHPERWGTGLYGWLIAFLRDHVFNLGKKALKLIRSASKG